MFKQLQDMALFALVAEMGSFTAAAQKAELPKSSVSQRISQLEQQVGIRLLNRTTRRLNLTFAGEHYLVHCREMLAASERAEYAIQRLRENPSGRLRITCPAGIGATLLAHMNAEFQLRYPEVSLDVSISDDVVDLVEAGFDVALRTGKPQDSSLIGRMIGHCPRYMLASPDYLAQHGTPGSPEELAQHNCLHYSFFAGQSWHFLTPEGESLSVAVSGNLSASISSLLMDAAIKHCGIAMLPEREARAALEQGWLVPVLEALEPKPLAIHGIYQSREYQPAALRAFLDELARYLA